MGGRQAVRPRPLEPVSKVRILPAQPASSLARWYRIVIGLIYVCSAVHQWTALFILEIGSIVTTATNFVTMQRKESAEKLDGQRRRGWWDDGPA
jgi:hypothetical protein